MHQNFTNFKRAIAKAQNCSAITATLLLFILLLLAKSASAQAVNPTPATQSVCVGASVSFTSSYNGSGGNKADRLQWQYSPTGVENSYQTLETIIVPTDSYTTTYTIASTTTSNTGYYRVRYLRPNGNIIVTTSPATLTVNALPIATISTGGAATIFCSEGSVTLSANSGTGFTYQWQRGGVNISGATDRTYSAIESGNYRVVVTSNNCSTPSEAVTVNEVQTPTVTISTPTPTSANPNPTTFCTGGSVQLSAVANPATAPAPGTYSYTWFNGGTVISGATASTYTATSTGNYTVVITNNSTNPAITCPSPVSNAVAVTVNPFPTASITFDTPLTFCSDGSVILKANSGTNFTYQWQNGTTDIPGETGATYTAKESGNYRVIVTSNGCASTSTPVTVNKVLTPTATISTPAPTAANPNPTTFCIGGSVLLTAVANPSTPSSPGVYTYTWYRNNITVGTGTTYSATEAGNYTVIITNTNTTATCPSPVSAPVAVTVNPFPSAVISAPNGTSTCPGGSVLLNVTPIQDATYAWFLNGSPIAGATNASINATNPGSYSVEVTTTGCTTTSLPVAVVVLSPSTLISQGPSASFCAGAKVTLSAVTGTNYTYQWYKGGVALTVNGNNSFIEVNEAGSYTVDVIITGTGGCTTTSNPTVVVETPAIAGNTLTPTQGYIICANTAPGTITGGIPTGGNGEPYTYRWERSEDNINFTTIPFTVTPNFTPGILTKTTWYRRVVISECSSVSNTVMITVNPVISGNTLNPPANTTICANTAPGTITGNLPTGGDGNFTYQWESSADGILYTAISTATAPDFAPGNLTATTWFRRVAQSGNCSNESPAVQIIVNQLPIASAGSPQILCSAPGFTLFTLTGTGANANFQWTQINQTGNANARILSPSVLNSGVEVTGIGTVTLQLTATSNTTPACGSAVIETVTLTVTPSPTANAGSPQAACVTPNFTEFTLAGQGSNGTFAWEQVGSTGTATSTILAPTSLTSGVQVTGIGTVTLRLITSSNTNPECGTATSQVTLTVNPLPTVTAGPADFKCSTPNFTAFTLAGNGTNATFEWTQIAQTGTANANILNPTLLNSGVNVTGIGSVTLQLTATSNTAPACGNPVSSTVVLTVNPSPTANAGAPQIACAAPDGTAIGFTLAGQGSNGTFFWEQVAQTGNASASISSPTSLTSGVQVSGIGTVTLKLITSSNTNPTCNTAAAEVTLTVNPLPTVSAGPAQILCAATSGTTAFTLAGTGSNATFQWTQIAQTGTTNVTSFSNAASLNSLANVSGAGTVTLRLTATSNTDPTCGTIFSDVVLTVNPLPTAAIQPLTTSLCQNPNGPTTVFTLNGNIANGNPVWSIVSTTGGAVAAIGTPTAISTGIGITGVGTVVVRLTVTSDLGCGSVFTDRTLTVNPLPTAVASSPEPTKCVPFGTTSAVFQLNGQGSANGTFQWSLVNSSNGATVSFANATSATTSVTVTGTGTVTLRQTTTSETGCGNATAEVVLSLNQAPQVALADFTDRCTTSGVFELIRGSFTGTPGVPATVTYSYGGPAAALYSVTENGIVKWYFNPALSGSGAFPVTYTVSQNGCTSSATKNLTVKVTPPAPTFTGVNDGDVIFTGEGNKPLSGSMVGATSGVFSGFGVSGNTFNPCAAFNAATAGDPTATFADVVITYTVSNGNQCSNATTKTVRINKSVYQAVVTSNLKPFCRGDNVTHTVRLYREAVVIYPYLTNAAGQPVRADGITPIGPQEMPIGNPAYPFPANTPNAVKLLAYRFFNPIVVSGTEIPNNGLTIQWTKNQDQDPGPNKNNQTFSNAGLSSLDYYAAYVTASGSCPSVNTLISSRTYTGQLTGYDIELLANKNPICPGDEVTFTAVLNNTFEIAWSSINLQLNWIKVTAAGVRSVIHTSEYMGTPAQLAAALEYKTTNLQNGDRISIEFTSNINEYYGRSVNKCQDEVVPTNVITMVVAINQTLANIDYCAGGTGTIRLNGSQSGISYQLLLNGSPVVGKLVAGTGNRIDFTGLTAGSYSVQTFISNSPCLVYGPITLIENPLPAAPQASNQIVCSNGSTSQTLTATANVPAGFTVIWYTTLTGNTTTNSPTLVGVGTVTYYAALRNTATTCISATRTAVTLTINALPTAPTVSNPNVTACTDGTATQTLTANATVPSGFSVIWYTTATGSETTTTPTQVGVGSKTYYAAAQNTNTLCFSANRTAVTLTIYALPSPPTASNQEVCSDGTATQTITATATVPTGFSVIWYTTATGNTTTNSPTRVGVGTIKYYAALQNTATTCISATRTEVTLTINPLISHNVTIDGPFEEDAVKNDIIEVGGKASYTALTILDGVPVTSPVAASYKWTIVVIGKQTKVINTTTNKLMVDPVEGIMTITVEEVITDGRCFDNVTATSTNEPFTPLPVEMLYFTAEKKQNNLVVLEWATAMEKMNEGFQIEVSQDAKNYRTLSFVPTKNGNTNQKQVYTFHDKENGKYGTRYYRIKQLDVDGTAEYFGPKAVTMDELVVDQVSAYPNPFRSEINLQVNAEAAGSMHVIVSNAVGAKVLERTVSMQKGSNKAQLQLNPNLPLGMYIVTTRLNGKTSHIKLMKE